MDDMQSYFERRRFMQFKTVLDEMRKLDVVGNLRQLGDDLKKENGLSIAQCEYWSDTLDRWADDLVDPVLGRHLTGLKIARQFAALDRSGSACRSWKVKSISARRRAWPNRRGRPRRRRVRQAGREAVQDPGRSARRVDKVIDRIRPVARCRERVRL